LVLTETDVELFRWLWMVRVLTLGQLQRVGYYQPETGNLSSLHNVRKRLQRLWRKGYLSGDTVLETRERIYFLAERALPALRRHHGIPQRRLYQPRGSGTWRQVHHSLMISECAVRVLESLRESDLELLDLAPLGMSFYHTHAVGDTSSKKHVERFISQADLDVPSQATPLRIRPDLVFALTKAQNEQEVARLYFLEADRGFESAREIAAKLLAYHHYATALDPADTSRYQWQRYGPVRDFRVLLVTSEQQRARSLVRSLKGKPGFELTAVASFDAVKEKNLVFDPIWTNAAGRGRALARGRALPG
jgi:hypothetical protein